MMPDTSLAGPSPAVTFPSAWPEHPEFGAFHTAEVPYVFDHLGVLDRPWEPLDRLLAETVASYWVNFATNGNPNGDGLPAWPTYDEAPRALMVLGEHFTPRVLVADDAKRTFFEETVGR